MTSYPGDQPENNSYTFVVNSIYINVYLCAANIDAVYYNNMMTRCHDYVTVQYRTVERKERKKSLTRGHVEDIGSTTGIQSYMGRYEGVVSRDVCRQHPGPLYLCDGGALRGSCRASHVCVWGCLLLRGR